MLQGCPIVCFLLKGMESNFLWPSCKQRACTFLVPFFQTMNPQPMETTQTTQTLDSINQCFLWTGFFMFLVVGVVRSVFFPAGPQASRNMNWWRFQPPMDDKWTLLAPRFAFTGEQGVGGCGPAFFPESQILSNDNNNKNFQHFVFHISPPKKETNILDFFLNHQPWKKQQKICKNGCFRSKESKRKKKKIRHH